MIFSQLQKMSFAEFMQYMCKRWMALFNYFGLMEGGRVITKDRGYSIKLDAEEKMLLNRILNKISVRAAVRLIETDFKCTSTSSIHFFILFNQFHLASISIWFRWHIDQQYEKSYYISDRKYKKKITPLSQCWHQYQTVILCVLLRQRTAGWLYPQFHSPEILLTYRKIIPY